MKNEKIKTFVERATGLPAPEGALVLLAAGVLAPLALLLNLGVQPFFLEEPRRVMVAMEMWHRQDLLTPRQLGEYYYKKPPFFNWILLIMARTTGGYAEWAMRLPTVLSTLGIGALTYVMGRRYVDAETGWLSGLLFVGAGGILFDFSMLAEIDLFYSAITYAAILGIFHFYRQERYWALFLSTYLLTAIGIMTKGAPSIAFTGISLLAFLGLKREWRLLFSWRHIFSGVLCLLIVGAYLAAYGSRNDLLPFLQMQLGESSQRTVAEQGIWPLIRHFFSYPPDLLKNLLPGGLLLLFLVRKDLWSMLRSNAFIHFAALMLIFNFLPYWLSPGARQRYIYVLYPFAIILLTYAWRRREELAFWRTQTFNGIVGFLLIALLLGTFALPFVPAFAFLPYRYALTPVFGLALAGWLYGFIRRRKSALYWLVLATMTGRLIFDLTVLPQRAQQSGAQSDRSLAEQIHEIVGEEEVYLYCAQRISFTTVVYLNKLRGKPLERLEEKNNRDFFLLQRIAYDDPRSVYLTFQYSGREYQLVKFE